MKRFLFILLLAPHACMLAQVSNLIASSSSLAQTSVADSRSWSAFQTPAALARYSRNELAFLFDNRFFIKELSNKSLQAAFVTDKVNVGLAFSHFGYSLYHEMMAGVGLARNFADKFSIGVQFNYYTSYFAADNLYRSAILGQAGLMLFLSPKFHVGFHSFNPFQTHLKSEYSYKRLPSVYSLGLEYFMSERFTCRMQGDREIASNYRLALSFDYRFPELIMVKLGAYASQYLVPCLGLRIDLLSFAFDLNCELHPVLGLNSLGMITYKF